MKALVLNDALLARWNDFLKAVAAGTPLENALLDNRVTTTELDLITRTDPLQDKRWLDARLAGEHAAWPALAFEDVCNRISAGMTVNDAIVAVRGAPDPSFFRVAEGIPQCKAQFTAALRAWTLTQMHQLEEIAADTSRDTIDGPKGTIPNMAAVQRARLRADMKKTLLVAFNRELFSDQKASVQVTINNHAELLEDARARLVRARRGGPVVIPQQMREAVDATFSEAQPAAGALADAPRDEELPASDPVREVTADAPESENFGWMDEKQEAETEADAATETSEAEKNPWKCFED